MLSRDLSAVANCLVFHSCIEVGRSKFARYCVTYFGLRICLCGRAVSIVLFRTSEARECPYVILLSFGLFDRWRCKHVGHSLSTDACVLF